MEAITLFRPSFEQDLDDYLNKSGNGRADATGVRLRCDVRPLVEVSQRGRQAFPLEESLRSATLVKSAFHKLDRRTTIDLSL
jgi:hypothetical protein